ncbi:carbohydrate ABC transporter permease [Anaerocolumna xylanovorans]|uniref:Putative aldouronate transport system permease protein n=1 Tax=Anaerocolumna xylanovorans DSM 12503 TaxID=1121345 RepID=A0A1M7Y0Z3_9FIRM|nr:carbohydrate ABC transporter permease [Anaerocolumna xylanovorans]SHO45367.1 putative aldouronate transport system permease protein [Anaerocolumna xylanovorans DSM 12503]
MIKSKSYIRHQILSNTVLFVVTLIMVLPLVMLFMSSISSERTLLLNGYSFIPKEFSLDAYRYILSNKETIFRAYGMTILVTVIGTGINMFLSASTGYVLSVKKLPFRNVISFYVFFTMIFSGGLVPTYLMWTTIFHIKNTILALIVPNFLLSAMNVILIRTYYSTSIPEEIYESAKIDGASYYKLFTSMVLPMGKPILVTVGLFTGLTYWNDWTNGLYYVNESKLYTVQILLNKMIQDLQALQTNASTASSSAAMQIPTVSVRMAIAFVALFPILVLYPFLQKYFTEGVTLGAVKG